VALVKSTSSLSSSSSGNASKAERRQFINSSRVTSPSCTTATYSEPAQIFVISYDIRGPRIIHFFVIPTKEEIDFFQWLIDSRLGENPISWVPLIIRLCSFAVMATQAMLMRQLSGPKQGVSPPPLAVRHGSTGSPARTAPATKDSAASSSREWFNITATKPASATKKTVEQKAA
jgi:hypothetical protein